MFDVVFQNSLDMIILTDLEGNVLDANIQALRYLGVTLQKIRGKRLIEFIKDTKEFRKLLENTKEKGQDLQRISILTKEEGILPFDVSASLVGKKEKKYSVFLCRNVIDQVESDAQRKFLYELFQHDLLNKLHAEIGFIDFYKKITSDEKNIPSSANQMISKIRDLTVKSIYLIQNINIMLMLQDFDRLSNQNIEDSINHAIRYLKSFFSEKVAIELVRMANYYIAGDDYFYRVFVNLILRMVETSNDQITAEITVEEPHPDKDVAIIILHFEDAILTEEEKNEIILYNQLSIKKLDVIVIKTLIERYRLKLKIENIRRKGKTVGTRMILTVPVSETSK